MISTAENINYTKEEKFICTMIWGAVPKDSVWAKATKVFINGTEIFKTNAEWQELFKKENNIECTEK